MVVHTSGVLASSPSCASVSGTRLSAGILSAKLARIRLATCGGATAASALEPVPLAVRRRSQRCLARSLSERPRREAGAADLGRTHRDIRQLHMDARPLGHVVDDWQEGVCGECRRLIGVRVHDLGRGAATRGAGERGGGRRGAGRKPRRLAHELHRAKGRSLVRECRSRR
eukprot:scaffold2821_cov134-Isochrysis_galbana.AAC.1